MKKIMFLCLIVLFAVTFEMPVSGVAVATDNMSLANVTAKQTISDRSIEKFFMNVIDCQNPSVIGDKLVCRSKDGIFTTYDKTGRKIFSVDKKKSQGKSADRSKTVLGQKIYGSDLEERAINGQFDQITRTNDEDNLCYETQYWCDPPVPMSWSLIGYDVGMYYVPDWWSDESLPDTCDLHATVFIYNGGNHDGIMTTLDATGGQYVKINLDSAYNDPVAVYLDNIKLGTVQGDNAFAQFDISNRSWNRTSELKVISDSDDDMGSTTLIRSISLMANNSLELPKASFNATPRSGETPLVVVFFDTSTGNPTSWNWSFGDGGTSMLQNPSHIYTSAGTYNVSLTAGNAGGSDGEMKMGYVTVAQQTTFTVYADGVGLYHGFEGNTDLFRSNKTPVEFYDNIVGKQGVPYSSIHWEGIGKPIDDATGSGNWNINGNANSMANNADFALHAGHGWNDGILFGTANPDYKLFRSDIQFGGNNGKAKWVAFFSCDVLNQSTKDNWESVFNGLHILMAFDTHGVEGVNQGLQFAQRMTGDGLYPAPEKIREAWKKTLKDTVNGVSIKGAYMAANPSSEDYLPGFGSYNEPVKNNEGKWTINWGNFTCERDW